MYVEDPICVKEKLREIYAKNQVYNALSFGQFLGDVASAKNTLTRYIKGTLSAGEGALLNAVVIVSNSVGTDVCKVFETPAIIEKHYSVVRAILHYLGLPYSQGPHDKGMQEFLLRLDQEIKVLPRARRD